MQERGIGDVTVERDVEIVGGWEVLEVEGVEVCHFVGRVGLMCVCRDGERAGRL